MARDLQVIWVKREREGDRTTQIRLNSKQNSFSAIIPRYPIAHL